MLDAAVPERPCFIVASDGHSACLNSGVCEAVGLIAGTADPLHDHFVLDVDNFATGMPHEEAIDWAIERLPKFADVDFRQRVRFGHATSL